MDSVKKNNEQHINKRNSSKNKYWFICMNCEYDQRHFWWTFPEELFFFRYFFIYFMLYVCSKIYLKSTIQSPFVEKKKYIEIINFPLKCAVDKITRYFWYFRYLCNISYPKMWVISNMFTCTVQSSEQKLLLPLQRSRSFCI